VLNEEMNTSRGPEFECHIDAPDCHQLWQLKRRQEVEKAVLNQAASIQMSSFTPFRER
jgi:hypothetical protein